MRVSTGCEIDVGIWRGGPVTFGRGRLVPVHLRIEDAVAHDGGEGGGLGLEVALEERLVQLLHDGHQRLLHGTLLVSHAETTDHDATCVPFDPLPERC